MIKDLLHTKIASPIGNLFAVAAADQICLLEFEDQPQLSNELDELSICFGKRSIEGKNDVLMQLASELALYFNGKLKQFKTPILMTGTIFQQAVWTSLLAIPIGETRTYKKQSLHLGNLKAIRAVARANGKNKIAIIVPCHRVIGTNGDLTGYAGGLERKRFLLELERKHFDSNDLFSDLNEI